MRDAVIVSTARTPIGRAYRGAFNNTEAPTLGGHAIGHAVARAGVDPAEQGLYRLLSGSDIGAAKAWVARRPKDAPEPTALPGSNGVASTFSPTSAAAASSGPSGTGRR